MRKLIFFDIDGTISSEETGEIPESAILAIRQARENGHLVFINTGRTAFSVQKKYREIGFDGYVCGCGTAIYIGEECIFKSGLSVEKCKEIVEMARKTKVTAVYESSEAVFFDQHTPKLEVVDRLVKKFGLNGRNVPDTVKGDEFTFEKFCVWVGEEADFPAFYEFVSKDFDCVDRGNHMYEWMPKGISKASGIQMLMDHYKIPLEDCFAIGDSTNDLPMLQYVPNSIAMGNSMEEILPYCAYVTTSVEEDGVWNALKHYNIITSSK